MGVHLDIFQLVYVAQAREGLGYSDLQNILETAQENNKRNNITGLLVYRDDQFLQILEGEQDRVMETLGRILLDRRASHVQVLAESTSSQRIFNRWPLAFLDADIDQVAHPLMLKLFETVLARGTQEKNMILQILESFRQSCVHFQEA